MVEWCRLCGTLQNLEKHHIKPLSEGGKDTKENSVYLCEDCHEKLVKKGRQRYTPKGKNKSNVGTFYLSDPYKLTWQEFRVICIREGTTASKKLVSFMTEYVQEHKEGNPQLMLETFIGDVQHKCFGCEGMFKNLTKVKFISGRIGAVCSPCKEDYQKRGLIKKVLGAT